VTYAFPLGIYKPAHIQGLDCILAKIVKRALHLPLYTPNAMVLQETDKMGLGVTSLMMDYVQSVTVYLTRALNDKGPLGTLTRSMMMLQTTYLGGMQTMDVSNKRKARQLGLTKQFHLANQYSLKKSAGLDMQWTAACQPVSRTCQLLATMMNITIDPKQLGEALPVPDQIMLPLYEIGIHTFDDIMCKGKSQKRSLISTTDLVRKYGKQI